ncbi:hypothetical protein CBS101457_002947 [Exobasidium rhododendri]|nr:hypothetical protein CBS101457_002947 [Exobasidium rhododendri]
MLLRLEVIFLLKVALLVSSTPIKRSDSTVTKYDPPGSNSASGAQCQGYYFPVTVGSATMQLWGQLCANDVNNLGKQPVQVLVHGGSYNHIYYDWPYQPERYNYVRNMTAQGFTTLNLDRLGDGYSDHPPATELNFDLAASNLHQVVGYLRDGSLGSQYKTVVANGYSMGGLTAQVEASQNQDLDAILVHAVGHGALTPRSITRLTTSLTYPALLDDKFSGQSYALDPAYLTNEPGQRGIFYGPTGTYDPTQLVYEEEYRDLVSATELADITLKSYTDLTKNITIPTLWTIGQYDKIWCGTTDDCNTDPETANEPSFYQPGVFTGAVIQDTGHGVLLGYGGQEYMARVAEFLTSLGIIGVV